MGWETFFNVTLKQLGVIDPFNDRGGYLSSFSPSASPKIKPSEGHRKYHFPIQENARRVGGVVPRVAGERLPSS
jgi:hypothetical protein